MPARPAPTAPGECRELGGRPAHGLHGALVLGGGADREPDARIPGECPQRRGDHTRDADDVEHLLLDDDVTPPEDVVREVRLHRDVRRAVPQLDRGLDDDQQPEGGDEPDDRGRIREQPQHHRLEQQRDEHCGCDAAHDRQADRPRVRGAQLVERDVRRQHPQCTLGEVDDAGSAVDEHDTLREQRVRRPEPQPGEQHLQEVRHDASTDLARGRGGAWLTRWAGGSPCSLRAPRRRSAASCR